MAISILFAEDTNDTNKKAAISSILCKAAIVIEFPGKCYWWMLLFKRRLSCLWQLEKKMKLNFSCTFKNNDAYYIYAVGTWRVISVHGEDKNTFIFVAFYCIYACSKNTAKKK